jgi:hypothetical protein
MRTLFLDVERFLELLSILQHVKDWDDHYYMLPNHLKMAEDSKGKFCYFRFNTTYFACRQEICMPTHVEGALMRVQ